MVYQFDKVSLSKKSLKYLAKRGLLNQFAKQVNLLLEGDFKTIDFKRREPKSDGNFYFRINKQFRAIGKILGTELIVHKIDNHQD